ncbi:prolactin-like [Mixophyes fleayi]|uniref:prolactin-like n=1 Tax=Mixophyes fleayi TaxID=3061075 RepID=UPI003F4E200A
MVSPRCKIAPSSWIYSKDGTIQELSASRCCNLSMIPRCALPIGNYMDQLIKPSILEENSISRKLLFALLISNMFLMRSVVFSSPICTPGSIQCQVLLSDLFDRAIKLSHYIHSLSTEMFEDFDQQHSQGHQFIAKAMNNCHTSTLSTPEDKDQTLQLQHDDLLSLVNKLLRSWSQPLHHLSMGAPDNLVRKLKEAEEQTRTLQGGVDRISGRMLINLDDFYPQMLDAVDVTVPQGESQLFSTYHLLHCFRRDSHKIDNYLKILRCRMIHANNC